MKLLPLFFLLFISTFSYSATCKKLQECISVAETVSGKKIIYDKRIIRPGFELNTPIELNSKNIEKLFPDTLNLFGLARLPSNEKGVTKIIEAREIRFHLDFPHYKATKNQQPNIPENLDPVIMSYTGVKGVEMDMIAERIRPLLSRYGRVQAMRDGTLVVADFGEYVLKIYEVVQKQDFPLSTLERTKRELEEKREHELEMARLKSGDIHEIGPHKAH